jgi:hypothetical protein
VTRRNAKASAEPFNALAARASSSGRDGRFGRFKPRTGYDFPARGSNEFTPRAMIIDPKEIIDLPRLEN